MPVNREARYPERQRWLRDHLAMFVVAAVAVLTLDLLAAPAAARAQTGKIHRVAILGPFSTSEGLPYREAFLDAMRDLGYVEGRNVIFDVRLVINLKSARAMGLTIPPSVLLRADRVIE